MEIEKEVFIPVVPPSQNDFQGRSWKTYYFGIRSKWKTTLGFCVGEGKNEGKLRHIEFIHYRNNYKSLYDDANFIGGLKAIVDILKRDLHWMKDDRRPYFRGLYDQRLVGEDGVKEEGILIRIFREV